MNLNDLHKVWEIKALKKAGEDEARRILERVSKHVQPIMRKRKWRVKLLSEFCPKNPALLGLNVGAGIHVKLRLRRPNRDSDFFPFEQILDTMLHELCHIVHGPHNANFYKLWDELRKECEELMSKGITGTGEGFDLPGKRLGGFSRQPPLSSLRQTALSAAEKRARLGSLLSSAPKRLGGDSSIMTALSPIQAAAMAAERRLQDDIWCGSEHPEMFEEGENNVEPLQKSTYPTQAAGKSGHRCHSDAQSSDAVSQKRSHEPSDVSLFQSSRKRPQSNFWDLTDSSVPHPRLNSDSVPQKRGNVTDEKQSSQSSTGQQENVFVGLATEDSTSAPSLRKDAMHDAEESKMWECKACTLLNPPLAPICKLCSSQRPKDFEEKYGVWSCKFCTLENSVEFEKCTACEQWRYSYGQPVATSAAKYWS